MCVGSSLNVISRSWCKTSGWDILNYSDLLCHQVYICMHLSMQMSR